ncbi:uncharacterized protein LOC110850214 isoform X1 [Folsomia candida]|uniref:uncharacterized protein LOC110850214 isoform X1 n=1 Tax=Folsomia candida TaxID=158441 RepID=UPI000B8F3D80|nr:uncharacterized protein LOC110850214 isoform X1 [Folsomia candida]
MANVLLRFIGIIGYLILGSPVGQQLTCKTEDGNVYVTCAFPVELDITKDSFLMYYAREADVFTSSCEALKPLGLAGEEWIPLKRSTPGNFKKIFILVPEQKFVPQVRCRSLVAKEIKWDIFQ